MADPSAYETAEPPGSGNLRVLKTSGPRPPLHGGGDDGTYDGMAGRIARLEASVDSVRAAVDSLRHAQNLTMAVVGLMLAAVLAGGFFFIQRTDALQDKIIALPGQVSTEIRDITKTLADAILAAKAQQPQVILIPAPAPTPPAAPAPIPSPAKP